MERVQAPCRDAVLDRPIGEVERRELMAGDHAVLASRDGGDRQVTWLTFSPYVIAKVSHPYLRATMADESARFSTRL